MRLKPLLILSVFVLVFVFAAPVQPVIGPGPCVGCSVHFTMSISCDVLPVGVFYWENGMGVGCGPIVT